MSQWAELETFAIKGHRIAEPSANQVEESALFHANTKLRSVEVVLCRLEQNHVVALNRVGPLFTGLTPALSSVSLDLDATRWLPGVITHLQPIAPQLKVAHIVVPSNEGLVSLISRMARLRKLTVTIRLVNDLCDASVGLLEQVVELVVLRPRVSVWRRVTTQDVSTLLRIAPSLVRLELPASVWDRWDATQQAAAATETSLRNVNLTVV